MKPVTPADAIQKIDERIKVLRADLDAIRLCQHSKLETIEELTKLREELVASAEGDGPETPGINNLTAMGARRVTNRGKGSEPKEEITQ